MHQLAGTDSDADTVSVLVCPQEKVCWPNKKPGAGSSDKLFLAPLTQTKAPAVNVKTFYLNHDYLTESVRCSGSAAD